MVLCADGIPEFPSGTLEYIHSGTITGTYDPASTPVFMAVVAYSNEPGTDDWYPAAWDTEHGTAKVLYGAGSALGTLDEGMYDVWVKPVTANEAPLIKSGPIRIT
ncbi:hypothetical protein E1286_05125 [Nonomuraea terrae]|uniref:Carboxypeptidase regulatory-like domain-containing protein n=1 Tax=Nonomuraea terrae TaxID=2530383 RepID=A0A4R4Z8R6_9ACTN|nr:hypothetical protein [Nonomuraea terrae]TDD54575.1 hypothetical protein E1286_05125 [Nonomuraea terrae]